MERNNYEQMEKQKKQKWIMIASSIILYFSLLVIISYLRAPEQLPKEEISHLTYVDFSELQDGAGSYTVHGQDILLENQAGNVAGVSAEISLKETKEVQVSFQISVPEEHIGGTLIVDLCAAGYDRAEQEKLVIADSLNKEVSFVLTPGDDAPETASLRLFTTDPMSCTISALDARALGHNSQRVFYIAGAISLLMVGVIVLILARTGVLQLLFRKRSKRQGITVALIFFIVIYLPLCVTGVSKLTGKRIDAQLHGNFITHAKVSLSPQTIMDGSFQDYVEKSWNESFGLRGVVIKTYNQLRYSLFNEGTRIVGKNGSIFEPIYIQTALGYPEQYGCSAPEQQQKINQYVERLNNIADKLKLYGKTFIFYTTPSKAEFSMEEISVRYTIGRDPAQCMAPIEYFRTLRDSGNFRFEYLDSTEVLRAEKIPYPIFYKTGIHWSRPAEQLISQKLSALLQEALGKPVVQIQLGEVQKSAKPYWRDADVYDLLNVWQGEKERAYYEYTSSAGDEDNCPGIILMGGSFAMGYERDIVELSLGNVFYCNYDYGMGWRYFRKNMDDSTLIPIRTMTDVDLGNMLDCTDAVIVECNESVLLQRSTSDLLLEYLEQFLDFYIPGASDADRVSFPLNESMWRSLTKFGFYEPEETHIWATNHSSIQMTNPYISQNGLEIILYLPEELSSSPSGLSIFVNGESVCYLPFSESGMHEISIPYETIQTPDHTYQIDFVAGDSFKPLNFGVNDDRDLSFSLIYLGKKESLS